MDATRVDRWLWAVRLAKTRSDASALCKGGHVEVNGRPAKASTTVTVGDRLTARIHRRERVVEVTRVIDKRVGAAIAGECYDDHSPPEPAREPSSGDGPVAQREPGTGRPTKRDRRQLERWRRQNR
jgi:ribosome-associated heat shock protein Hsp15